MKPYRTTLLERLAERRRKRVARSRMKRYRARRAELGSAIYHTNEDRAELDRILNGPNFKPSPYERALDRLTLISQEADLFDHAPLGKSA